jgi:hypothetical protein
MNVELRNGFSAELQHQTQVHQLMEHYDAK